MHDFSWTLARLLSMNGAPVHITVGDEDAESPVLAAFGGILNTGRALDPSAEGEQSEIVVLSIDHVKDGLRVGALLVHRSRFRDAELGDDGVLRIQVGSLSLCIEPLGGD